MKANNNVQRKLKYKLIHFLKGCVEYMLKFKHGYYLTFHFTPENVS